MFLSLLPSQGEESPFQCGVQSFINFSSVNPFHRLQVFMNCPSVGPPLSHKSYQDTCSSGGFSFHRSLCLDKNLLKCDLPTGSQLFFSYLPWFSISCMGRDASSWSLSQAAGESSTWREPPFPSLAPWPCCLYVLIYSHSSLLWPLSFLCHNLLFSLS